MLREIVGKRDELRGFIDQLQGGGGFELLFREFDFSQGETADAIAASVWPLPGFDPAGFEAFAHAARAVGAKTIIENILPKATAGFAESDAQRRLELLAAGFLKVDGEPYAEKFFSMALRKRIPDLMERYAAAVKAITAAVTALALFRMLEATNTAPAPTG